MNMLSRIFAALFGLCLLTPVMVHGANTTLLDFNGGTEEKEETTIPFRKEEPVTGSLMMRVLVTVTLMLLLTVAIAYIIKKYFFGMTIKGIAKQRFLTLVEARHLSTRTTLFLLDADGRRLLLAQTGDRLIVIRDEASSATPMDAANPLERAQSAP
jgi:flagellar biogenesis protein FliO